MALDTDVLIIGAGLSGVGTAIQLILQCGTRQFEIIEKSDHVGGTWWLNSYPGCGCDVSIESHPSNRCSTLTIHRYPHISILIRSP